MYEKKFSNNMFFRQVHANVVCSFSANKALRVYRSIRKEKNEKIKIISTDFDGTLLKSNKKVTEKTRNVLKNARKRLYINWDNRKKFNQCKIGVNSEKYRTKKRIFRINGLSRRLYRNL